MGLKGFSVLFVILCAKKAPYEECVDIPCVQVQLENKKNVFKKAYYICIEKKVNEKKIT